MQRLKWRWQSQTLQGFLGILLVVLIVVLFSVDLHQRYIAAIDQGKKSAQNFAEILSEHTALTFENVEHMLREAAKIRKDSLEGDYASPEDVNAALRVLAKTSPAVVAVGWTDAAGKVVAHSYDGALPRTNVSQMAHFAAHRDSASDRIYVSSPFRSAASNNWLTAASLRLSNDDGTFAGIVTTPLDQSYFAKIYRSIDLGKEGSILLLHRDGLLLAREPALESAMGRSFASAPLLAEHLPKSDTGSYESMSVVDGVPRVAGYKAVRGLPLVVLVSFGRAVVLQAWYRHLVIFGPFVAFAAAAILFGTFLIVQQTHNLAQKSREIERTNTRFDMALSEMPNGLVMWSADQRIVIANSRFREMYGLKPEQVAPGTTLRQILEAHLANGERSELSIDEYIKIVSDQAEQIHLLADGRTIAMRRQRMPDGGWIATHQDITEHKRAEALLRTTLDTMDQGLIAADRDGRIALMNARVLDLLGLPQDFATRRPHKSEVLEYQRSIGEFPSDEAYTEVVRDIDERRHAIYERERPNGTVLEIRTVPTEDGGFVRTYSDVTARRAAEAALRQERDRAEAAARATTEFLANMSHELRTPLTAIIGVSDMLLSAPQSPESQRHFMEMQRTAGKGLLGVISDILDFSKIEAGQLRLEKAPLSLKELTDGCLELVQEQAQRKGVELTASIAQDVHDRVLGDAVRLRQVLLNLVGNAVKFTPSGSVRLSVELDAGRASSIRFAVTDTGIGISSRDLPALFQRFVQADRSATRRFGGSGLGLAISKELVTHMGGTIEVQSAPGRGSEFSFTIEMPPAGQAYPENAVPVPSNRASCRLLLAEDNPLNRELIKAMLERAGHEVVTVNDGAEAVRVAIRNAFDAILMDVQMPEMDGYTAVRAIRTATEDRPGLPIIGLTANALPGESERSLEAGMNVHVPKPVDWPALLATIERLVLAEQRGETTPPPAKEAMAGPDTGARGMIFDDTILAHLRKTLGADNARKLLTLFEVDAREHFFSRSDTLAAREVLCREAHTVGGSAGLLGFLELAEACRALEAIPPASEAFDSALDRCRRERDAALRKLGELVTEEVPAKQNQASA
jgi:PAS domain S-box-containing protein